MVTGFRMQDARYRMREVGQRIRRRVNVKSRNNKIFFGVIALFCMMSSADAQNYSFTKPIRLSKNVNSTVEESLPVLSVTADTLFFVRSLYQGNVGGKSAGQDIWMSVKDNAGNWSYAHNDLPALNNKRNNAVIGIDTSGTTLYLLDSYSPAEVNLKGVSKTTARSKNYLEPVSVKIKGLTPRGSFVGFYMAPTEDILLISMHGPTSLGEEDIYVSLKDETGEWSAPINLGPNINTNGFEISPFLSKDKRTLYFASSGHDGYGDADIFMSRRLYDNSWVLWSKPVNLGEEVNSKEFDAYPFVAENKKELYFVSNRNSTNADIYMSNVIEVYQEENRAEINPSKYKLSETEIQALLGMPITRTVYFDFGSFQIKEGSKELLDFLADKLMANPEYNVELIGHTDNEGSDQYNLELSRRRASQIERYLIEYGVKGSRLATKGVGKTRLLYETGTEEEVSKNRRVEIFFTKDKF